jgi:hypothetical protein
MKTVLVALVLFMLIMGAGMAWNLGLPAGFQKVSLNPTSRTTMSSSVSPVGITSSETGNSSTSSGPVTTTAPSQASSTPNQGSPSSSSSSEGAISTMISSTSLTVSTTNTSNPEWKAEWTSYAQVAWQFFRPGYGVSPTTGLIYASPYWHRFTDWDLGGYVLAVLAAEKIGLIGTQGTWGADYRLQLVLNFLDTRPLSQGNLTFQFYDSDTGTVSPDGPPNVGNPIDEGRLLIALYDTKLLHPELANQIQTAVNHVNYSYFASDQRFSAGDVYSRYAQLGFNLWGFKTASPPNETAPASGSFIIAEPVVSAILEGVNDTYMTNASWETYLAQYAEYNRTGVLMALSEGQYPPYLNSTTPYVYEGIEVPSGSSYYVQTWQGQNVNSSPEAFTKIGFAFYAIYRGRYGAELMQTMGGLKTSNGYEEGILTPSGQVFGAGSDNSNIMIMEACAYAINPI